MAVSCVTASPTRHQDLSQKSSSRYTLIGGLKNILDVRVYVPERCGVVLYNHIQSIEILHELCIF